MTKSVPNVTTLSAPKSTLKVLAKRTTVAAFAVAVGAAIYLKVNAKGDETSPETTTA